MPGPLVVAAVLKALEGAARSIQTFQESRDQASSLKRQSRGIMLDAATETKRIREEGDYFKAQQSLSFLKSGVSLEGSPLLALEETENEVKRQIDFINMAAQGQASQLRKARKKVQRSGRMALLTGGLYTAKSGYDVKQAYDADQASG